jgi:hypothetical protein
MPVDTDGVKIKVYPVLLSATKPVAVAFVIEISSSTNPVALSVVVMVMTVAQVIVFTSEDERLIPGL